MKPSEAKPLEYDVVIVGGVPGGIAAAIAAARLGRRVALVEYHPHLGGMMASGLGKCDVERREMIGGLFGEFVERIRQDYQQKFGLDSPEYLQCRDGYYSEPSVAEATFERMVAEQTNIDVYKACRLVDVAAPGGTVREIGVVDRDSETPFRLRGRVFIDATYEGDLFALAGAAYRVGRESRDEYGEPHAGVIYVDGETGALLPGSTGAGDDRLPAYTYRLCFTTDPQRGWKLAEPPAGYDREQYVAYLDDLQSGRLGPPRRMVEGRGYYPSHFDTIFRAFSVTELPNQKVDANINPRPLAFPFPEENQGYVEGNWQQREAICRRHRELTLGLLYFCQNDHSVPAEHREIANRYFLPNDEFVDNENFPFQLYVREARRLRGVHTLTEHDVTQGGAGQAADVHDAVAVGEFPIDSFPVRKWQDGPAYALEGYLGMLDHITRPYLIPYRITIPEAVDGLIVPVAASATHVAYSSLRMEPTWMAVGQAAGTAAHLALLQDCQPRAVDIGALQELLREQKQVLHPQDSKSVVRVDAGGPAVNSGSGGIVGGPRASQPTRSRDASRSSSP